MHVRLQDAIHGRGALGEGGPDLMPVHRQWVAATLQATLTRSKAVRPLAGDTHVTETVYRHVIVPAIRGGASVMDTISASTRKTKTAQRI